MIQAPVRNDGGMAHTLRVRRRAVWISAVAAAIALVAFACTFTGDKWSEREFASCQVKDRLLVLGYSYGAADDLSTSFSAEGTDLIVRLRANTDDAPHTAEARYGELRLQNPGPAIDVRDYKGRLVRCEGR